MQLFDSCHILKILSRAVPTVTSPRVNNVTNGDYDLVTPETAAHDVCSLRVRPSFSTRKPAGG